MFKQPAENTNATPQEQKEAMERTRPLPQNSPEDREREAELAQRLASEAGKDQPGEQEREQAAEVLRNRKNNIEAKP